MGLNTYFGAAGLSFPTLEQLTLAAFTVCNSIRVVAYVPQIRKAAFDKHGAGAISYTTWSLFLIANLSTVGYALVNRGDVALALCFGGNAICCVAILVLAMRSKYRYVHHNGPVRGRRNAGSDGNPIATHPGGSCR
jgi:hypothetical protein